MVKYLEIFYPQYQSNLSTYKSKMLIKNYCAKKNKIDKTVVAVLVLCTANNMK